jgi:hypothetical protein
MRTATPERAQCVSVSITMPWAILASIASARTQLAATRLISCNLVSATLSIPALIRERCRGQRHGTAG